MNNFKQNDREFKRLVLISALTLLTIGLILTKLGI